MIVTVQVSSFGSFSFDCQKCYVVLQTLYLVPLLSSACLGSFGFCFSLKYLNAVWH